jgi:NADH-quinone oxidoreductase subunit L
MVTAGIFMVARMSPLFELSLTALTVVMYVGGITALFMGFLGIIQNDIKRVVAYSTLSQLGYMTVALGVSAYAAGIFHLMTHAFFKALLFLAAGSVIIAMHHDQDIRNMGGLRKYMPITYWTSLVGSLALIGFPGFAGFYSKDAIIVASVHASHLPGSQFIYYAVLFGVFITALYSFRMFFLVFHGKERMDEHTREHLKESPAVVTVPLILLAIPSVIAGYLAPQIFGEYFGNALFVLPEHNTLQYVEQHLEHGLHQFTLHSVYGLPFWFGIAGIVTAWFLFLQRPQLADAIANKFSLIYKTLDRKYWFDDLYINVFAGTGRSIGRLFWKLGDMTFIDGLVVNGSAKVVGWCAGVVRKVQTGYLYTYAFTMILGLIALLLAYALGRF